MKRRILFVDDEPNVLEGLRRMLRPMRREWDMLFTEGGEQALDILGSEPCDVVVSDMRMPGMDGARLLSRVAREYPRTVRIVLSGHSDKELIMESVRTAHQYLSKPCNADVLKATVARACALRDLLENESLKGIVSRMDTLPSLPSLYAELMEELQSPEASTRRVGEIVSRDVGMSAKILQMVNSAFFGLCEHVSSPAQAAGLLGIENVRGLVLSVQIFSEFDQKHFPGGLLDHLWNHSMAAGVAAKAIATGENLPQASADHAFMAGLLHDSGKLVLASRLPDRYGAILLLAKKSGMRVHRAELESFGTTHAEIGAYLMGLWGLPDTIVEAIAFHHRPADCPVREFGPLTAVHAANALLNEIEADEDGGALDEPYISEMGLTQRIPLWRDGCLEAVEQGVTNA
ncbi:MAG: HDOD domain-containing protein [Candidatus Eisenbacteria sp.]|nr:HDOD domain-containing protein [Candidatus Eisenbacteria bacterium]